MAEEPRPQTIQERIASLNQSQVGRLPGTSPGRPSTSRAKTINNPPHEVNGSVIDSKGIGNKPAPIRQNGLLPPPTTSVSTSNTSTRNGCSRPPPPLPARKNSSQSAPAPAPALPPRRPSAQSERRPSSESVRSNASYSTTSTTGTANTVDSRNRGLAPAWGETELPPLPERDNSRPGFPRRKSSTLSDAEKAKRLVRAPLKPPPLPSRTSSVESSSGDLVARATLPIRTLSSEAKGLPQHASIGLKSDSVVSSVRKIPPAPSADVLQKARQLSFATLSKHVEEIEPDQNVPPAVPLSSRPDLSAIQATKPKFNVNGQNGASNGTGTTVCMICRDFSGPDNHAAQFPRQSLPTNDLTWLATQLTAPFSSLTDKARALFTWLHYNIKYDVDSFFNNCVQPSTPVKTVATGLAVCEGYAGLFATLATHAGLEAFVVGGHGKGFGHSQLAAGSGIPPFAGNHAWNVVKIDGGKWKLIDACWGAGAVQGKGQPYIQRFDPTNFTKPNNEFLLSHYPQNKDQFYTDDGGPGMSWEAYVLQDHTKPFGIEQPTIFTDGYDEGLGDRSFRPACSKISINQVGPIRFQFGLKCEHWTLTQHSKKSAPFLFLLHTHGVDGRKDEKIPFTYIRGTGPNGGGDIWFVDVADPRTLGAPGQKLGIANITSFASHKDARGLSLQEYQAQAGRVGMGWSYVAQWELIA